MTIEGTEICIDASTDDLGEEPTAAHIHQAPSDEAGDVVVDFSDSLTDDGIDGCTDAPDHAAEIADDSANFYLNIHTESFPDGAVRGQVFVR
ncbi:hypothetical protein BH24ACT3_BH24ACT3_15650 [soil metagenome]